VWVARNRIAVAVSGVAFVVVHREVLAVLGVNAERRVGLSFEIFHGLAREPLRRCDRFIGDDNLFLLGLRSFRNCCGPAMADEGHADSRETFRSAPRVGVCTFPQQPPQHEHRLGERIANNLTSCFREESFEGAATVLADSFQIVADVSHGVCGFRPARPLGAEFRGAFEHSLHFGGDGEHGITQGKCERRRESAA